MLHAFYVSVRVSVRVNAVWLSGKLVRPLSCVQQKMTDQRNAVVFPSRLLQVCLPIQNACVRGCVCVCPCFLVYLPELGNVCVLM